MPIRAHLYWTDTGLYAVPGAVYECRAEGRWWDLVILSGPDGYDTPGWSLGQRLATRRRRLPTADGLLSAAPSTATAQALS